MIETAVNPMTSRHMNVRARVVALAQLQQLEAPKRVRVADGRVARTVQLPRQGVSLLTLAY